MSAQRDIDRLFEVDTNKDLGPTTKFLLRQRARHRETGRTGTIHGIGTDRSKTPSKTDNHWTYKVKSDDGGEDFDAHEKQLQGIRDDAKWTDPDYRFVKEGTPTRSNLPSCKEAIDVIFELTEHIPGKNKDEPKTWFSNHYECPCGNAWTDEWYHMSDDECSKCGKAIEPTSSDDLSGKK